MKPCSRNREPISWLTLGALKDAPARELRAHIEICPGCRQYLDELTHVVEKVSATETREEVEAPAEFHRKVMGALRKEAAAPARILPRLRWLTLDWRTALPAFGTGAVAIAALLLVLWPDRERTVEGKHGTSAVATSPSTGPTAKFQAQPSIAHYQMVANRSLDELDDLLSRQGHRTSPSPPIQTATTLGLVSQADQ